MRSRGASSRAPQAESLFTEEELERFFPRGHATGSLARLCAAASDALARLMPDGDLPRVPGWDGKGEYQALLERYCSLPADMHSQPDALVTQIASDFFPGAVNWRCPELQYNLGAAVNVVSSALYAVALDLNVFLINDGLAGNTIVAEQAVAAILLEAAGVQAGHGHGLFTFGGTGTIAYAIKVGLRKAAPESVRRGRPRNIRLAVTEDAHFSHATAADWLGIGSDELLILPSDRERRSCIKRAERLLREAIERGNTVPALLINGGTTYDHAIDDIPAFVELRDRLVTDYSLEYVPHVHADSVVGWVWLFFRHYDFDANPLGLSPRGLEAIRAQYERAKWISLADSWGVDFHKGAGACPIDCSMFIANDAADIVRLRKGDTPQASTHQLADELSVVSPVDYTLETSRAGGKPLAALGSLHSLGRDGYRRAVANLIENAMLFRHLVEQQFEMEVLNPYALGYQTMVRLYEPGTADDDRRGAELTRSDASTGEFVTAGNAYLKRFFVWDNQGRMDVNAGGFVYSYTRHFVTTPSGVPISGLKVYPTSPRIGRRHIREAVELLAARKLAFDLTFG
ncbi:hypothetical protein [Solirubrobacter soli]|uniref:hypothetical protein n=1 Tax=Solirubrobacter soli TaxID=363832 RepID=UPI0004086AA2|nr:hypothetical protein [Solirubrobacter soli]